MSSGFQIPITIKNAIDNIYSRKFLLPAIQRKFTWSHEQIEMLFDSIMRGYPINSFLFWKIKDEKIKSGYKFYEFITEFREFFAENNKDINTEAVPDFEAIIDGQQRLTSLYIGLRGSYAYKMPRKWWKDNEECLPTRKLYLNLISPINQEYDNQKEFDFRFLSESDIERYAKESEKYFWFNVGSILNLDSEQKVKNFIIDNGLSENAYSSNTLNRLHNVVHTEQLINYYLQEDQEPDKILEIFIRANSGGTPLSFSDLLMSISSANWKSIDARKEIDKLISEIYALGNSCFWVNKDFVLKTCLVLFIDDIRFQLKNFTHENVKLFEDNWGKIRESIITTFTLLGNLGFNDRTLRAKNAAIPIIYYVYHNNLQNIISSPTYKDKENKKNISKWLILTFIKSIFGGQTDTVLKTMKQVLDENKGKIFPDKLLMKAFKNDPARNYSLDDEFIDGLLESQKGSDNANYLLHLLYPNLDYSNQDIHQDHLHPASIFENEEKFNHQIPLEIREFAQKPENWNGISNLQLLNGRLNESKKDKSLKDWFNIEGKTYQDLFLSDNTSLEVKDFDKFILDRKENIKQYIKNMIEL